jgi:hypothetical protein
VPFQKGVEDKEKNPSFRQGAIPKRSRGQGEKSELIPKRSGGRG